MSLLAELDSAAAVVDGGASFAAMCRRVAEDDMAVQWLNEMEQVLWLLDDGLDAADDPGWVQLAQQAADEWGLARAPQGEGHAAYAGRWLAFLRLLCGG